jgi:hypothetical protein|tara:strand:+ start:248 stop:358 length:111 start_codon:yes stop_codon:yes gene_type:complete
METMINFLLIGLLGIALTVIVLACVVKFLLDETEVK